MDLADPRTLLGTWAFHRVIDDRRAGDTSQLDGRLVLLEDGDRIRWEENAVWHRPDGGVDVRRGQWLVEDAGEWQVLFEDGRPFHRWSPGEQVVHDCTPDVYRGSVTGTPPRWRVVWEVSGPAKDYTMVTDLAR